jgi:hypothetical protein
MDVTPNKNVIQQPLWTGVLSFIYGLILLFVCIDASFNLNNWWSFFTFWSNVLCAIWLFLYSLTFVLKKNKFQNIICNKVITLTLVNAIVITWLVVVFCLYPFWNGKWVHSLFTLNGKNEAGVGTLLFMHLLSTIVMCLVFYFMKNSGKFSWKLNFYTIIYPLFYFLIILILEISLNIKPPYFFVAKSYWLFLYVPLFAAIFYGVSYLLYKIKFWLVPKQL